MYEETHPELINRPCTDPRMDLEQTVASVITTPEFERELLDVGSSLASFQRDWRTYGSFMAMPQNYRAAINWAQHEIQARSIDAPTDRFHLLCDETQEFILPTPDDRPMEFEYCR